jgi:hypothetical protein
MLTLDMFVEGNKVTSAIPNIEKPDVLGMKGVWFITLIEGKDDTIDVPLIVLGDKVVRTP